MVILEGEISQKLDSIVERFEELGLLMSDPKIISNQPEFQRIAKERSDLSDVAHGYMEYKTILKQLQDTNEILEGGGLDLEMRLLAEEERSVLKEEKGKKEEKLKILLIPKDPKDDKNTFLEIRAGAGGEEAALFAADLLRMYYRYSEKRKWHVETLSINETGIGGLKEVVLLIEGKGAYSFLKYESGVHRVQRIPVTETGGRIHTSTITVAVLPEAEDVDIHIDQKDLRIDTFCSSGPGGQSVNTTYSAIRITHLPSGIIVNCQDERSQLKNKGKAMRMLRSRLLEIEKHKQENEISQTRKEQVGTGDRSERIRTYNFPQNRVTDHRLGLTLHKLDQVLEGNLDEFIEALIADAEAERLKG